MFSSMVAAPCVRRWVSCFAAKWKPTASHKLLCVYERKTAAGSAFRDIGRESAVVRRAASDEEHGHDMCRRNDGDNASNRHTMRPIYYTVSNDVQDRKPRIVHGE